jgi:YVTN family beta-propeller protein
LTLRTWAVAAISAACMVAASCTTASVHVAAPLQGTAPASSPSTSPISSPSVAASESPAKPAEPSPKPSGPLNIYAADVAGAMSPVVAGFPERVYVPNTLDGTVTVIDPATYKVIATLDVGGVPHHVTPSWDLRHLYVDNPGSSLLQVLDPKTASLTGDSIRVPAPYNLYFTPDGKSAIVVAEYDHVLEFRDRKTWALQGQVYIQWPGVDHIDFSADGTYLLASCEYSGEVVKVSVAKRAVTANLHVGGSTVDVKIAPDGKVFYVANQGLGGVSVIDPETMQQIQFIATGSGAHGFAVSRDAKFLYVSNRISGTISVVSFASRKVVHTWSVGGSPDMLQVSPDGKELWATNRFGDSVTVASTKDGRVLHVIVVGREPHGLAYFPEPGRHCIGHNGVFR